MHIDGQCPVCGHALEIKIFGHRAEPESSSKLRISGLSAKQKKRRP